MMEYLKKGKKFWTNRGLFDGLFWDGYAWEGVHSTLHRIAADALHSVQNLFRQFGLLC